MWLKKFLRDNLGFLFPFLAFVAIGGVLLYLWSKEVLLIAVNSRFSAQSDLFFKYYTHVGDGNTCVVISVLLFLFVSKYKGLLLLSSYAIASIPTQIIKLYFFQPSYRPRAFFWTDYHRLHFVDGVDILVSNSFPSGHTATAFSMFLVFSHFVKNKLLALLYFLMAFFVGYSRLYLAQHFFADAYSGSIIAVVMTILTIYLAEKVLQINEKQALRNGILNTI